MNIKIFPSQISGSVAAPPSKSVTHRALILAALARGTSTLKNVLLSDDTLHTMQALQQLGVSINQEGKTIIVTGADGNLTAPKEPLFVGNSGLTMRMITAVSTLAAGTTIITGEKRLHERPMQDLLDGLKQIGTGTITIDGSVSSQYITALLLIAPFAKEGLTIIVTDILRSKPYVTLTINLMKTFGVKVENKNFKEFVVEKGQKYQAKNYTVEGDYSSASYFFAAAAVTGGKVTIRNLNENSAQGDRYFLDLLQKMECSVQTSTKPKGITVDMNDYPDIVQTLAVVASFAKGKTTIKNIGHLKDKETNRISATANELTKMGIRVKATNDSLAIIGGKPKGATIETHNDHRMAMSFAVAGLSATGETTIQNADVVNKSYPNFWEDLKSIGAKIEIL